MSTIEHPRVPAGVVDGGAPTPVQAILVPHTHWDREWYLTVEQLRPRLVRLFDNLRRIQADEPDHRGYWLDGQTCILEDYWESVGERPQWLADALLSRRILCGPWYTQVDEFLTAGESVVRNLLEGRREMRRYRQENLVGYLPDTFGHVSQMPSILRGFGIDNAFLFRGVDEESLQCLEARWTSAAGESVFVSQLRGGYSNAQRIDADLHLQGDRAAEMVTRIGYLARLSESGVLLLLNGVDQSLPTHGLDRSIERLASLMPGIGVRQGSPIEYLELVRTAMPHSRELPHLSGELLHTPSLDAALSARGEQKAANRRIENLLLYYVEPLLALSAPAEKATFSGLLRRSWRLVMLCHAHDSICGCHSDLVAEDVNTRLSQAEQLALALEQELWVHLLENRPNEQVVSLPSHLVFRNPLPWQRQEVTEIEFHLPAGVPPEDMVFEQHGRPLPGEVLSVCTICRWTEQYFGKVENKDTGTQRVRALVQPTAKPGAFVGVSMVANPGNRCLAERRPEILREDGVLDNGLIRVRVFPDGRFDVADNSGERSCQGLNRVFDTIERGDLYEHVLEAAATDCQAHDGTVTVTHNSPLRGAVLVSTSIECSGVECPLSIEITLNAGEPIARVRTSLDNRSRDHWLRTGFPLPAGAQELLVHTPFDVTRRGVADGSSRIENGRIRFAERLGQPMQWGILARGHAATLGILNRGLYEYTFEDPSGVNLSLMRCVGLIRPDLTNYSAQGANRPGRHSVEYAVGLWSPGDLVGGLQWMLAYSLPLRGIQTFGRVPRIPDTSMALSNPYWMPSAFKPAEDGDGFVVRIWNASENEQSGEIHLRRGGEDVTGFIAARLDETEIQPIGTVVTLPPKGILTVIVRETGKPR